MEAELKAGEGETENERESRDAPEIGILSLAGLDHRQCRSRSDVKHSCNTCDQLDACMGLPCMRTCEYVCVCV